MAFGAGFELLACTAGAASLALGVAVEADDEARGVANAGGGRHIGVKTCGISSVVLSRVDVFRSDVDDRPSSPEEVVTAGLLRIEINNGVGLWVEVDAETLARAEAS